MEGQQLRGGHLAPVGEESGNFRPVPGRPELRFTLKIVIPPDHVVGLLQEHQKMAWFYRASLNQP